MKFLTLKHPSGGIHQIGVCISHEGKAQIAIDGGDWLTPTIGMSIDWGDGIKTPNVVLCFDWNGKKRTGDIRVELFEGWIYEGRNYAILNELAPEAAPAMPLAPIVEDLHADAVSQ